VGEKTYLCQPWGDVARLCCPDETLTDCDPGTVDVPATYKYTDSQFLEMASNILFRITCYRFPGICSTTIKPCVHCVCTCSPCNCVNRYEPLPISLTYPLVGLTSVVEGGVAQPLTNYRIDDYSRIVRLDNLAWPRCNNLSGEVGDSDVWEITLDYGRSVPLELQYAAETLACQLKKACDAQASCELPAHVRNVVRQGVSIEVDSAYKYFAQGLTGVQEVDQILQAYTPCNQKPMMATHPLLRRGFIVPGT